MCQRKAYDQRRERWERGARAWLPASLVEGHCGELCFSPKTIINKGEQVAPLSWLKAIVLYRASSSPLPLPPSFQAQGGEDSLSVGRGSGLPAVPPGDGETGEGRGRLLRPGCTTTTQPRPVSGLGSLPNLAEAAKISQMIATPF